MSTKHGKSCSNHTKELSTIYNQEKTLVPQLVVGCIIGRQVRVIIRLVAIQITSTPVSLTESLEKLSRTSANDRYGVERVFANTSTEALIVRTEADQLR